MDLNGSRLTSKIGSRHDESAMNGPRISLVPALLGTLAVMNIASVVLSLLIE